VLSYALPVLATLFIWWFSTGLILFLDGLPRQTFKWSMAVATLVGALAMGGIWISAADTSPGGAYLAFACAILIWGWNEMSFLLGHVTGSRRTPCPAEARGLQRFVFASQSIIYHECLILLSGAVIAWVTWGADNRFALWTFLVLWGMRLSTKLNIFLGVPNITVEFLPQHLAYLKSYFANKPMNLLFPASVTISTLITALLVLKAGEAGAGSHAGIGHALLATLMALAVIEHWFLVIPLPFGDLWSWGLKSHARPLPNQAAKRDDSATASVPLMTAALADPLLSHGNPLSSDPARGWQESLSCAGVSR
jgi:putative photosynthetic complex assembly protein 2